MAIDDKKEKINNLLTDINGTFLKPMKAKLHFEVECANRYHLFLKAGSHHLKYDECFYTYDDVISALNLILDLVNRRKVELK